MALRNQPYIPLYVQDYLTDEKLNMCSAATQGIYIKIMCFLHKSDTYGAILFKQNQSKEIKQNFSEKKYFAYVIQKQIGFSDDEISFALDELLENKVLLISKTDTSCILFQKRMVHDFRISCKRSKIAIEGGGNPVLIKQNNSVLIKQDAENLFKQNPKQNSEYEYEYIIDNSLSPEKKELLSLEKKDNVEIWTESVISKDDFVFWELFEKENETRQKKIIFSDDLAKSHEAKAIRENYQFKKQQHFRKSLLSYLKNTSENQQVTHKKQGEMPNSGMVY